MNRLLLFIALLLPCSLRAALPIAVQATNEPRTITFSNGIVTLDQAYGPTWDGSSGVPSKNALYDKIESIGIPTNGITAITASNVVSTMVGTMDFQNDFGAVPGRVITNVTTTSASTTVTAAAGNFSVGDVGKVIRIRFAGVAQAGTNADGVLVSNNRDYSGFVSNFVNSGQITLSSAAGASVSAVSAAIGLDSTAALQGVFNYAATNGGARVHARRGAYLINGAFQNTGSNTNFHNAQVYMPVMVNPGNNEPILEIFGDGMQPSRGLDFGEYKVEADFGTVFISTVPIGPNTNICRMMDFRDLSAGSGSSAGCGNQDYRQSLNGIAVFLHDMTFRGCRDANIQLVDLRGAENSYTYNLTIDTGSGTSNPQGAETFINTNSFGLMVAGQQNENIVGVNNVMIRGFYNGLRPHENLSCPYMFIADCVNAIDLSASSTMNFTMVNIQECKNYVHAYDCSTGLRIDHLNTYNYAQFTNTARLTADPFSQIAGKITAYHAGVGPYPAGVLPPFVTNGILTVININDNGTSGFMDVQYTPFRVSGNSYIEAGRLWVVHPSLPQRIDFGTNDSSPMMTIDSHPGTSAFSFTDGLSGLVWLKYFYNAQALQIGAPARELYLRGNVFLDSGKSIIAQGTGSSFAGNGGLLSNAVNITAGANVTVTPSGNGRTFQIASSASGSGGSGFPNTNTVTLSSNIFTTFHINVHTNYNSTGNPAIEWTGPGPSVYAWGMDAIGFPTFFSSATVIKFADLSGAANAQSLDGITSLLDPSHNVSVDVVNHQLENAGVMLDWNDPTKLVASVPITVSGGVRVDSGKFTGNGAGITNIPIGGLVSATNTYGSAVVVFPNPGGSSEFTTNLAGNLTFTGIGNFNVTNYNYFTLHCLAGGANRTILPAAGWHTNWIGPLVLTNGGIMSIMVSAQIGVFTNMDVINRQ